MTTDPRQASHWVINELLCLLHADGLDITQSPIIPQNVVDVIAFLESGRINMPTAKYVFKRVYEENKPRVKIV